MNLIIDVGNTLAKAAVFHENEMLEKQICEVGDLVEKVKKLATDFQALHQAAISSVGKVPDAILNEIEALYPVFELSHEAVLPFTNLYGTPHTLGVDRLALVSAAALHYPSQNALVIDAGSCITYDFLDHDNRYLGGAIAPGLEMRYKAMNTFTANLPLLEKQEIEQYIGDTTASSMHVGVIQGVANEIDGFIDWYTEHFTDLTVILTGGDAHFLRDRIKNDIFANSNFLLEGLNHVLEINRD